MQKNFEQQKLPRPVEITEKITGDKDHGLWDFFKDQKLLQTPVDETKHGARHLLEEGIPMADKAQDGHGQLASCEVATGRRCTCYGGYA